MFLRSFSPSCASFGLAATLLLTASARSADTPKADVKTVPRYTLTDLGPLPAVADEVALKINDAGQVAGWAVSGGIIHATLWTDGKPRDLGVPTGFRTSVARGLNSKGEVVGWAVTSRILVDSAATTHACLFAQGRVIDLGTLGGQSSQAFAINDDGQIAGVSSRADGTRHAFLFQNGRMTDLGTLPGGRFSRAYAVNASGEVVGIAEASGHALHGFRWRQGRMTDLGVLPGGRASLAYAVNASGETAGSARAGSEYHAARYPAASGNDAQWQDLGTLGEDPAAAFSLNDRGQIVGASNLSTIVRHAFLWENGRMSDLNTKISADTGWTLVSATGINRTGGVICFARRKGGAPHAVILTPISP